MSKGSELVKLAKEDNASKFGDVLNSTLYNKISSKIDEARKSLYAKSE